MKKTLILLIIILFLVSCKRSVKKRLSRDGESMRFTYHDTAGIYIDETIINLDDPDYEKKEILLYQWTN